MISIRQRPVIPWPNVLEERHEHLPMYIIITVVCENWRNSSGWFIPVEPGRDRTRTHLIFQHPSHRRLITSVPDLARGILLFSLSLSFSFFFNHLIRKENGGNYPSYFPRGKVSSILLLNRLEKLSSYIMFN